MPKRKRAAAEKLKDKEINDEEGNNVLGGMRDPTGDTRSAGSAAKDTDQITHFKIPFSEKQIICQRHRNPNSKAKTKDNNRPSLVFTHGAGGGIENPATKDFVTGFASAANDDAICFQGTMNLSNRTKTFHAVLEDQGRARALGGRSMGSRAAVVAATECNEDVRPEAVVLVSYPLTSEKGGKTRKDGGEDPRKQILLDLPEAVDVLFVIGSADNMCDLADLREVRGRMKARSWVMEVKSADHGMSLKPKAAVQGVRLRSGAVAAEWLETRDQNATYGSLEWNADDEEIYFSGWQKEGVGSEAKKARKR